MDLEELQWNWNEFGKTDPLYAILTVPSKRNNRWHVDEFFKTGETEIQSVIGYLNSLGRVTENRRALDFGCGVGRLTQALCRYYQECDGVDIAPSMISAASQFNRFGDRCRYHLNEKDDLRLFDDNQFDFMYSMIVLQHIAPPFSSNYIREFIRVLKPDGLALFQIPSAPIMDQSKPLGDDCFAAKITVPDPPKVVAAGNGIVLKACVQNAGAGPWPVWRGVNVRHPIRLGNHWLRAGEAVYRWDDGRASLANDLLPCEQAELELMINAPLEEGEYILELDMVQEHVGWFQKKGSVPLRLPLKVLPRPASNAEIPGPSAPNPARAARMEMHCIPRDEVARVVTSSGGLIVDIREDGMAGGYEGYRYCITK
jgi:SAM-dependent methyltransferase